MTPLEARLIAMIEASGPMPLSAYMETCLHDPKDGYYATQPGLGRDFITAPETSQVFGELLGLWAAHEWREMGAPEAFNLCEIGPGRGTLMEDALRASQSVPGVESAAFLTFIEPSPVLRAELEARFETHAPVFHRHLAGLPPRPTIMLANEWLDCLPARQFTQVGSDWFERVIGLNNTRQLAFGLATDKADPLPSSLQETIEVQPGLEALVHDLEHMDARPWRILLVDYGPSAHAPGDTLRAYKDGAQVHPLAFPGESDLTVDVDFSRLKRLAETAGLQVHGPIPQGGFLMRLGIETRMQALIKAQPEEAETIYEGVRKLVDPSEMGQRFNVICISSPDLGDPAGF